MDQSTCLGVFSLESPLFHSLKPRCYISSAYSYRLQMSFIATSFLIPLSSSSFASVSIRLLLFLLFFRFNSHAFGLSNTQNVNALIFLILNFYSSTHLSSSKTRSKPKPKERHIRSKYLYKPYHHLSQKGKYSTHS